MVVELHCGITQHVPLHLQQVEVDALDGPEVQSVLDPQLIFARLVAHRHHHRIELRRGIGVEQPFHEQLREQELMPVDLAGKGARRGELIVFEIAQGLQEGLFVLELPDILLQGVEGLFPEEQAFIGLNLPAEAAVFPAQGSPLPLGVGPVEGAVQPLGEGAKLLLQPTAGTLIIRCAELSFQLDALFQGLFELLQPPHVLDVRCQLVLEDLQLHQHPLAFGGCLVGGEVLAQDAVDLLFAVVFHQVEDGIIRQAELALQGLHFVLVHAGELAGIEVVQVHQHEGKAFLVDPPAAGPARHLEVLPVGDGPEGDPVPFGAGIKAHRLAGEVQPHSKGFGAVEHRDQTAGKQLFHNVLEHRQHPRVVIGDTLEKQPPQMGPAPALQGGVPLQDLVDGFCHLPLLFAG